MAERPWRRRARHAIITEILEHALNGQKKTNLMYKAHLNFAQLERYLSALKNADFITTKNGIWKTTQKGLHVIKACKICQSLMKEPRKQRVKP